MKHKINPTVDCVFKAILGSEENKNLLIHFLNAILEPEEGSLIKEVLITNPYNEAELTADKVSIPDVKAIDDKGQYYQIEIQPANDSALSAKILYAWSGLYLSEAEKGEQDQKPAISIWIIDGILFENVEACHLPFSLYNNEQQSVMNNDLSIHLLQLPKWQKDSITTEKDRWIYLFKEGKNVDVENPPEILNTDEMKQAIKVLQRFSENETDYCLYQSRLDAVFKEKASP